MAANPLVGDQEKPQPNRDESEIDPQAVPAGGKFYFPEPPPRDGENTENGVPFRVGNG